MNKISKKLFLLTTLFAIATNQIYSVRPKAHKTTTKKTSIKNIKNSKTTKAISKKKDTRKKEIIIYTKQAKSIAKKYLYSLLEEAFFTVNRNKMLSKFTRIEIPCDLSKSIIIKSELSKQIFDFFKLIKSPNYIAKTDLGIQTEENKTFSNECKKILGDNKFDSIQKNKGVFYVKEAIILRNDLFCKILSENNLLETIKIEIFQKLPDNKTNSEKIIKTINETFLSPTIDIMVRYIINDAELKLKEEIYNFCKNYMKAFNEINNKYCDNIDELISEIKNIKI